MKISNSKDGVLRFTVKVSFRAGLEDCVNALAIAAFEEWDMDGEFSLEDRARAALLGFDSRKRIVQCVSDCFSHHGTNHWGDIDGFTDEAISTMRQVARAMVLKRFPEFKDRSAQ